MKRYKLVRQYIMQSDVDNREIAFWIRPLSKKRRRKMKREAK